MRCPIAFLACVMPLALCARAGAEVPWPGYLGPPSRPVTVRVNDGPSLGDTVGPYLNEGLRDARAVKNAIKAGQSFVAGRPDTGWVRGTAQLFTPTSATMPPGQVEAIRPAWTGGASGGAVRIGDALSYVDLGSRMYTAIRHNSSYELVRESAAWQVGRTAAGAAATFTVGWLTALGAPPAAVLLIGAGGAYVVSQGAQYVVRTGMDGAAGLTNSFITYLTTPAVGGGPAIVEPLMLTADGLMPLLLDPHVLDNFPRRGVRLLPVTGGNYGGTAAGGQCPGNCPP